MSLRWITASSTRSSGDREWQSLVRAADSWAFEHSMVQLMISDDDDSLAIGIPLVPNDD